MRNIPKLWKLPKHTKNMLIFQRKLLKRIRIYAMVSFVQIFIFLLKYIYIFLRKSSIKFANMHLYFKKVTETLKRTIDNLAEGAMLSDQENCEKNSKIVLIKQIHCIF